MLKRLACMLLGHRPRYFLAPLDQGVTVHHSASVNGGPEQDLGQTIHVIQATPRLMVIVGAHGQRMELDECSRCGEIVRVHP